MNLIAHITAFANHRIEWIEWIERARTRNALLALSDRNLADAGFSRELLEKGVKAWPWKVEAEADVAWASKPVSCPPQLQPSAQKAQKTSPVMSVQSGLTA